LFNGKNLDGWHGDPRVWSVENGVIQGSTEGVPPLDHNTFLTWRGEELADFDLHAEFRIIAGNSGIQYRSRLVDESKYSVAGYQADIDAEGTYTGILYEEGGRGILALRGQRSYIAADDAASHVTFAPDDQLLRGISAKQWNTYEIEAHGARLRHRINGRLMSETEDHSTRHAARSGTLALQAHTGPPMTVQFRNLRIRRHPGGDAATTANAATWPPDSATPAESLRVPAGFQVELLYSIPADQDASWVSLAVDPRGRLLASDQDGSLFRIVPAPAGSDPRATFVEQLPLEIGSAQGMCFVDDRLYVVVNSGSDKGPRSGLYRVEDSDADGEVDAVTLLRSLDGEGEHGPHAVIPSPTGDKLYIVAGNHTKLPALTSSKVPMHWGEDQLLHRLWDARGHAVGILAPGGWICATDLAGQDWELFAIGFRNAYDLAFHESGELFTFDSDMEWDIGAPWYRPTRVCHVTGGAEFGWRSGSGKWLPSFPDSLPPVLEHGPGSPTGVTFGYDTGFPDEYRKALFIGDWSFGRIDCVQLTPRGGSFDATATPFVTGTPLPVTDIVSNRHDGALYFAIGGRKTQSGLYRVSYQGPVATSSSGPVESAE
jgi:glucose/arabinose dehydrogenase